MPCPDRRGQPERPPTADPGSVTRRTRAERRPSTSTIFSTHLACEVGSVTTCARARLTWACQVPLAVVAVGPPATGRSRPGPVTVLAGSRSPAPSAARDSVLSAATPGTALEPASAGSGDAPAVSSRSAPALSAAKVSPRVTGPARATARPGAGSARPAPAPGSPGHVKYHSPSSQLARPRLGAVGPGPSPFWPGRGHLRRVRRGIPSCPPRRLVLLSSLPAQAAATRPQSRAGARLR